MARVCRGDDGALEPLILRYGTRIRTYLDQIVRDGSWADDLTQEVFVRVFESAASYDETYPFSVWLFRIARNLAVDLTRRQGTQKRVLDAIQTRTREREDAPRASETTSPLEGLERKEFLEHFESALARLPESFRTVFVLREMEGMSYEEIALIASTNSKTVSTRLHRARMQLRRHLEPYLGIPSRIETGTRGEDGEEVER